MGLVYISKSGVVLGPYDEKLIPDLMDRGVIEPSDLATPEGSETWVNVVDFLQGVNTPQTHEPVLMNAPEIRAKGMDEARDAASTRSASALPKPLAHEAVGGTGVTSPALNLYQTRSSDKVDAFLRRKKQAWLTTLLNLFLPGAGQVYLGKWVEGLVIAGALTASVYFFTIHDWLWMIAPIAYLVCVISSISATRRYQHDLARELGLDDEEAPKEFFTPIFTLVMALLFLVLYYHQRTPETLEGVLGVIPRNITEFLPETWRSLFWK